MKGRFRDALEFDDSILGLWVKSESGPTLTLFLVKYFDFDSELIFDIYN